MANYTFNFDLIQPEDDDYYDISQFNENMEIIDQALINRVSMSQMTAYARPVFASYVGNGQTTRTIQAGTYMKLVFLVKDGQIVGVASKDTPYVSDGTTYLQVYDNHFVLGGGFCNESGITYSYFGL